MLQKEKERKDCDEEKIRREETKLIKNTRRISIIEETSGVEITQDAMPKM